MKATTQNTNTQNTFSRTGLVVVFVLFLLSSVGMFGQNIQPTATSTITIEVSIASSGETVASTHATTTTNTTMNFVSWFMGTKQSPSTNQSNDFSTGTKKQMINSGIAPNRLLIKTLLKKATNYNSTIA
ncbi:hypothetical protein [Flavobacterium luteum]|uniref:Uncharacterized protein n=1 Tax=Flavobacterium luteum TaxID=2026654 RepID=A0A7J5AA78_9FLAO|nr:hypothetical protein [Flavobacterium luteum]KAB1154462.1 hypothetical protein F6464_12975 [Flavobacterium luteum]